VLVPGGNVTLTAGKGILGVDLASAADNVKVIITDPSTGKDVDTIELGAKPAGTVPLAWDGVPDPTKLGPDGKPVTLRDGKYLIRVVATQGGEELKDAKALSFDTVASVTSNAKDGVKLNLPSLGLVTIADVRQIL
jgi:flagellar basal-body rod modification protein FlgD